MHQPPNGITRRGPPLIAYVLIFVGTGIVAAGGDDPILTLACGASLALSLGLALEIRRSADAVHGCRTATFASDSTAIVRRPSKCTAGRGLAVAHRRFNFCDMVRTGGHNKPRHWNVVW